MTPRRLLSILILLGAMVAPVVSAMGQAPPAVGSLPDSERRTAYSLNGSNCSCAVNLALFASGNDIDAWLQVWINGVRYLSTDPSFGWSLSSTTGPLSTIPRPITNAILTFNQSITGTAQIVGAERPRQLAQFSENTGVPARALNQRMTEITAVERELWDKTNDLTGRGLFFAPGNVTGPMPSPAACAGAILGFDVTGLNPLCMQLVGLSSGTIVTPTTTILGDIVTWGGSNGKTLLDAGGPPRVQLKASISYYVNGNSVSTAACGPTGASTCSAGSDSNNCLTPTTACLTTQHVVNIVINKIDLAGFTATIYLAHGSSNNYAFTCTGGPVIGQSVFGFAGDSNAPTAVTIVGPALNPAVQVKDGCTASLTNLAFADNGSNNTTQFIIAGVGGYGHVDVVGVTFGALGIGTAVSASYGGSITLNGANAVTGSENAFASVSNGGTVDIGGTVAGSAGITWGTGAVIIQNGGTIGSVTPSTFIGFSGVSGPRCYISTINSPDGYNPNQVYPGSTDCVINQTVGALGVQKGSGGSSTIDYGTAGHPLLSGGGASALDTWDSAGVTCSGSPTSSFASVKGIVTHC